jgi:hypothetical protein
MAYLAPIQSHLAEPLSLPAQRLPVARLPAPRVAEEPDFSELEWSVVRLAQVDRLWTIRPLGPLRRFYGWLVGRTGSPSLANPRLEALRRISVLTWHFGFSVPGEDVAEFLAAGFTIDQYELLVTSVRRAAGANVHAFPGSVY